MEWIWKGNKTKLKKKKYVIKWKSPIIIMLTMNYNDKPPSVYVPHNLPGVTNKIRWKFMAVL